MKFGPAYHLMIALASYVLKSFLVIVIRILLIQEQKDLDMCCVVYEIYDVAIDNAMHDTE